MCQCNLKTKKNNYVYVSTVTDQYARFWNYETKIFELFIDENFNEQMGEELYCAHYKTKDEAIKGHKDACMYAINNL